MGTRVREYMDTQRGATWFDQPTPAPADRAGSAASSEPRQGGGQGWAVSITQKRLPSGSASTTKSGSSG
jgi:hypothetical protein